MIDTHCHIHDQRFDDDRDEAVERARRAGVTQMLTIGEDLTDSRRALSVAQRYDLRASVGIHPHEAKNAPDDIAIALEPLLADSRVVAIGETGLDYYYDHSPRATQAKVLRAQLGIARERVLPVIFHQRDAFDDFVGILRQAWSPQMRGVVHCFTGTVDQARTLVDEFGLALGIGGVVTFQNAQPVREAVRAVGIDAIVLETDAPYLAPVPVRGKRNEPSFLPHTARRLSELLGISLEQIVSATDRNADRLFGLVS
jgi:TatD DNase family protein